MSLDVYLQYPAGDRPCTCKCRHQHTRVSVNGVYSANITHNLGKMAQAAGIYEALWRPDEHSLTKAGQLIQPLEVGLAKLKADPELFSKYNSPNGWGMYEHFVPFVEKYLEACQAHPDAEVHVSR